MSDLVTFVGVSLTSPARACYPALLDMVPFLIFFLIPRLLRVNYSSCDLFWGSRASIWDTGAGLLPGPLGHKTFSNFFWNYFDLRVYYSSSDLYCGPRLSFETPSGLLPGPFTAAEPVAKNHIYPPFFSGNKMSVWTSPTTTTTT